MNLQGPPPRWVRHTCLGLTVVFTYVNVLYGAIEPAANIWQERKAGVQKILKGEPAPDSNLMAQLPSVDLGVLPQSLPKAQNQIQDPAPQSGAFSRALPAQ